MPVTEATAGSPTPVVHLEPAQRAAIGRAARATLPRSAHAGWASRADRPDPAELLLVQETTRVPELVPLRHERMLVSPFTFYRGAAVVMAADLGAHPNTGLRVQACGDAHLSNFGGFASPDRTLVFDINDFDETHPGPFEWDVKRLGASFEIAARSGGFTRKQARNVVLRATRTYREAMASFAAATNLDVWYARLDVAGVRGAIPSGREPGRRQALRPQRGEGAVEGQREGASTSSRSSSTVEHRIKADPPVVVPHRRPHAR